jgi:hypothetical protein
MRVSARVMSAGCSRVAVILTPFPASLDGV